MSEPNPEQERLITSTEGTYRVDAGAGTGKTYTITRRYANILSQPDVEPDDILLVTFTRNAATEMRDRIVDRSSYDLTQLQTAPINTFHGYCYRLLRRYGETTPHTLGIDEVIPPSTDLLEDEVREAELFGTFAAQFEAAHPEHEEILATIGSPASLRSLISQLAAKGVVPTADGWYRDTAEALFGDRESFVDAVERANAAPDGNSSDTRTGIRGKLDTDMTPYGPDAPDFDEIIDYPQANMEWILRAFDESREDLVACIHDLYFEYLSFMLSRNTLTQGLMLVLAFVMLRDDATTRAAVRHEYVMIDEFQDTNELQFKLTLLLAGTDNLCVVGDWKQSIYAFQYTNVENIRQFESRLTQYLTELTADDDILPYTVDDVTSFPLVTNYRSTQSILDTSTGSLTIPASNRESIDTAAITGKLTELDANAMVDNSQISAVHSDDEPALILDRIQHIVGNDTYAVEVTDTPTADDDATPQEQCAAEEARLGAPTYGDIAIFTRTRSFARELLEAAAEYDIPIAYEGGIELYDTDQAKLLLAWLRIVELESTRGWATVLEAAGYTLAETRARLHEDEPLPTELQQFRDTLQDADTVGGLARRVFDKYGYTGAYANALVEAVTGLHNETVYTRAEAIERIEEKLAADATPEVDANPGENAVKLQTIHSAKGLEYPIVLLANVNQGQFPHYGVPDTQVIRYDDQLGIRQTKQYARPDGQPHIFDRWQYDVLSGAVPNQYNEERRLLYVALTRAKRHLLITAGEEPSNFFTELPVETAELDPDPTVATPDQSAPPGPDITIPTTQDQIRTAVHDIMDDSVYDDVSGGRGTAFGTRLHDFAEAYIDTGTAAIEDWAIDTDPYEEFERIVALLDELEGELRAETPVVCPLPGEPPIVLSGIIDGLCISDDTVTIIDYKTDQHRAALDEYRTQLSVYHHVATTEFPDQTVRCLIYYTADDEMHEITPRSLTELRAIAEAQLLE